MIAARRLSPLFAVTLLAVPLLSACSDTAETPAASKPVVAGERMALTETRVVAWKDVAATVTSTDMADARARIPGVLEALYVREGDRVRAGQVIGRVVDSRLGYDSAAYGAQAAAAQAQLAQADAELARVRYLHANGVYAKARLEQAEAMARAARAQVTAAQAQQSAVGAVRGQGAVVAPSSGRVLMAPVPAGSAVSPGVSIATITSGAMVLRLDLPESLATQVRTGSTVIATGLVPGASADTAPRAVVTRVYPSVQGGQMQADVAIKGLDDRLVGRRVTARIAAGERMALIVPRRFVTTRHGIDYVRVAGAKDSVATIPVQLAPGPDAAQVEILSGARVGDVLIASKAAGQ